LISNILNEIAWDDSFFADNSNCASI